MGYEREVWYTGLRIGEDSEDRLRLRQRMAASMADEELLNFMDDAEISIRVANSGVDAAKEIGDVRHVPRSEEGDL